DQVLKQQQQVSDLSVQLRTAQERVLALSDSSAEATETVQAAEQVIDYLGELSAAAASVALALDRCAESQATLIGYLKNADDYTASGIKNYENSTAGICNAARAASDELQEQIAEQ